MFATLSHVEDAAPRLPACALPARPPLRRASSFDSHRIAEALQLVAENTPVLRRLVRAGDAVYQAGQRFTHLCIINTGMFKVVTLSPDGREQIVSLKFRGDWLGLDGIADGVHGCDAVAMDTGEVWSIPYVTLLGACVGCPELLGALHAAMSREIAMDRGSLMSVCTLPADARVADFLRNLAEGLERRGLRGDQVTLRMTRAEIGNYLGVTLETVSRAISHLARLELIAFSGKGRRDIVIPDIGGLEHFVQACLASALPLH